MTEDGSRAQSLLRTVGPAELASAVTAALRDGPVVAPLPSDPVERRRALAVLRPDRPVTEPDAAVVITTSGSTGRPKAAVLSRAAIRASVAATHDRLGGARGWGPGPPGPLHGRAEGAARGGGGGPRGGAGPCTPARPAGLRRRTHRPPL